jgi:2-methylisocitrate lyase-like PEP mutase family enzyme
MEPSQTERARTFRALHERPGAFVIPNPWDVGSARILAGLAFEALATTSAGMAFALGRRDGAVSRDEALAHAAAIAGATPLPVSADLENGFGDAPKSAAETIRLAAATGLVGASIEDATGNPDRPIYDLALATERIAAAVEAARALPFPFTLTARAENFLHGRPDLDDTIRRLQAFEAAGADVLYAPGLRDLEMIRTLCAAVGRPVNVIMGLAGAPFSVDQLAAAGVRRISIGSAFARAALGAFLRAAREVKERGTFTFAEDAATFAEIEAFMPGRA